MSASQPSLNIVDIADAIKVIDFLASKAVLGEWENVRQIMLLRDRLEGFVAAANAQSGATTTPADSAVNSAAPTALS